ncbi:MAG: hypothetical protein AAGA28_01095 [Pseudomonadota bacterium]
MDLSPLTRACQRTAGPPLRILDGLEVAPGRLHEICGPSRQLLALLVAAKVAGPVIWISPGWATDRLNPEGMVAMAGPERFLFVTPAQPIDLLWTLEETLRSGAVALAVAELPDPPGLTPVRRLHLAAESGGTSGHGAPLGLILTPGDGGAPGVESRWHIAPRHKSGGHRAWAVSRRRARALPAAEWTLHRRAGHFGLSSHASDPVEGHAYPAQGVTSA